MQRDRLLLTEIIDAAERIIDLASERSADDFVADRDRRDALLWNYTVLGGAIGQLSDEIKSTHGNVAWAAPVRTAVEVLLRSTGGSDGEFVGNTIGTLEVNGSGSGTGILLLTEERGSLRRELRRNIIQQYDSVGVEVFTDAPADRPARVRLTVTDNEIRQPSNTDPPVVGVVADIGSPGAQACIDLARNQLNDGGSPAGVDVRLTQTGQQSTIQLPRYIGARGGFIGGASCELPILPAE